ncbi:MAG: hypothetical protein ABIE84_00440 [bacterium]
MEGSFLTDVANVVKAIVSYNSQPKMFGTLPETGISVAGCGGENDLPPGIVEPPDQPADYTLPTYELVTLPEITYVEPEVCINTEPVEQLSAGSDLEATVRGSNELVTINLSSLFDDCNEPLDSIDWTPLLTVFAEITQQEYSPAGELIISGYLQSSDTLPESVTLSAYDVEGTIVREIIINLPTLGDVSLSSVNSLTAGETLDVLVSPVPAGAELTVTINGTPLTGTINDSEWLGAITVPAAGTYTLKATITPEFAASYEIEKEITVFAEECVNDELSFSATVAAEPSAYPRLRGDNQPVTFRTTGLVDDCLLALSFSEASRTEIEAIFVAESYSFAYSESGLLEITGILRTDVTLPSEVVLELLDTTGAVYGELTLQIPEQEEPIISTNPTEIHASEDFLLSVTPLPRGATVAVTIPGAALSLAGATANITIDESGEYLIEATITPTVGAAYTINETIIVGPACHDSSLFFALTPEPATITRGASTVVRYANTAPVADLCGRPLSIDTHNLSPLFISGLFTLASGTDFSLSGIPSIYAAGTSFVELPMTSLAGFPAGKVRVFAANQLIPSLSMSTEAPEPATSFSVALTPSPTGAGCEIEVVNERGEPASGLSTSLETCSGELNIAAAGGYNISTRITSEFDQTYNLSPVPITVLRAGTPEPVISELTFNPGSCRVGQTEDCEVTFTLTAQASLGATVESIQIDFAGESFMEFWGEDASDSASVAAIRVDETHFRFSQYFSTDYAREIPIWIGLTDTSGQFVDASSWFFPIVE